jgi:hypothetical protein
MGSPAETEIQEEKARSLIFLSPVLRVREVNEVLEKAANPMEVTVTVINEKCCEKDL